MRRPFAFYFPFLNSGRRYSVDGSIRKRAGCFPEQLWGIYRSSSGTLNVALAYFFAHKTQEPSSWVFVFFFGLKSALVRRDGLRSSLTCKIFQIQNLLLFWKSIVWTSKMFSFVCFCCCCFFLYRLGNAELIKINIHHEKIRPKNNQGPQTEIFLSGPECLWIFMFLILEMMRFVVRLYEKRAKNKRMPQLAGDARD